MERDRSNGDRGNGAPTSTQKCPPPFQIGDKLTVRIARLGGTAVEQRQVKRRLAAMVAADVSATVD